MKSINTLATLLFLVFSLNVSAQYGNLTNSDSIQQDSSAVAVQQQVKKKTKTPVMKRIYVGGNIGGGWSNYGGYFELSPTLSFRVTKDLHMGLRFTYIYSNNKTPDGHKYNYNDYGASILARYHFFKFIFIQGEFQELNFDKGDSREWIPALFLGGGLYQNIGNAYMHIGILWNVLDNSNADYNSPYVNPMMVVGFGIGI
jgi:hypothetical protein